MGGKATDKYGGEDDKDVQCSAIMFFYCTVPLHTIASKTFKFQINFKDTGHN